MISTDKTLFGLPPRLVAYIAAVVVLAAGALGVSAARLAANPPRLYDWLGIGLFLGLALIADLHPVPLDDKGSQVSLAFVFLIAVLVIFGWAAAIPVAALSILLPMLFQGNPVLRAAFNSGAYAIAAAGAGATNFFGTVGQSDVGRMCVYALVGGLIFVLINAGFVSGAVALAEGLKYRPTVLSMLRYSGPAFAIMAFLAALAANLWAIKPALLILLAGPLFALSLYQHTALRSRLALHDALTDNLTGLGNHRSYQATLRERIASALHDHTEFSLCIVDVDDFKRINDTYGHQVGDDVLVALSAILSNARDGAAFRCGGDEFALLFDGDGTMAFERVTEVQDAVAALGFTPVTISVGIASFPGQAADADGLQRMADGALYWSKHHGKNRSFVYSPKVVRIHSAKDLEWETERMARLRAAKNIVRFVDAKDPMTADHSETVAALAAAIGHEMGLDDSTVDQLALAGLLHDIGKIGIADSLLQAARPLTPEEFVIVKTHSTLGYSLLEGLGIAPIDEWILHHHEDWDGRGYPDRLAAQEIPLGARIIRVADAFEAMTANRPYRSAQSAEYALEELRTNVGIQFDAVAVAAVEAYLARGSRGETRPAGLSIAFA
ncbi:MAG TPA: diguanylate cyclase [Gaiellaceae bacterium]|nr:diguanylate cyclase [Gaiellaceae bacterium]